MAIAFDLPMQDSVLTDYGPIMYMLYMGPFRVYCFLIFLMITVC